MQSVLVKRPSNVAICVTALGDDWLGGVNYYHNLVRAFSTSTDHDFQLYVFTDTTGFLEQEAFSERVVIQRVPMLKRKSPAWFVRKVVHVLLGRDALMLAYLKKRDVGLVAFSYVAGASKAGIVCAPWIPDFQFKHHPELFSEDDSRRRDKQVRRYVHGAGAVIVSSEAARGDAAEHYGVEPSKLRVLHFAPFVEFESALDFGIRDRVLAKYDIDRPYFFLPNQYWKHKNHLIVARALKVLRDAGSQPLIVSTGKQNDYRNPEYFAEFCTSLAQLGLADGYRMLGVIPRQDMMVLLANSIAVINPSRFEGWSTTVEEAKAFGKPLLVSDIPVHREQVSHYSRAFLFNPDDATELARGIKAQDSQDKDFGHFSCAPDASLFREFSRQYLLLLKDLLGHGLVPTNSVP